MTIKQKVEFFYKCQADKCANCARNYVDRNRLLGLKTHIENFTQKDEEDLKNIEESLKPTCEICKRYKNLYNDNYQGNEKIVE